MKTDPEIYIAQACNKNSLLRQKLTDTKVNVGNVISRLKEIESSISRSLDIEYSDQVAFFELVDGKYDFRQIIDMNDLPEDIDFKWDLAQPLAKPETLPEFEGF